LHRISQSRPSSTPGPSFQAIANRQTITAAALRKYLLTTHATIAEPAGMPNPNLSEDQVTHVVALRSTTPSAK